MTAPATATTRSRVDAVDVVRGIIMIIMALDHTRDYFGNATADPTNLATTTVALFFTRWITHICAPVFFLLTGTAAYLAGRRRSPADLSRLLFTRGLWLIALEFTVFRFIVTFNVDYRVTVLTVLWALGWSMVALSLLVRLPVAAVGVFGVAMILTHNLLDGATAPLIRLLHSPTPLSTDPSHFILAVYPLIPWIGVSAFGFALGRLYDWEPTRRRQVLIRAGAALIAAFIALRFANIYGDPSAWKTQKDATFTLLSFLNTTKYPPSLLFLLMTLGPAMLLLAIFDQRIPRALRPALIIGRVPMVYFLAHFTLIHILAVIACLIRYGSAHWMFEAPSIDKFPFTQPPGWPSSLPVVYAVWASVVIALYPLCRWYAALRERRRDWWLSYL
jgi:uncharacterized membrane protein